MRRMDTWSFLDGEWQRGDLLAAELRWFDLTAADSAALDELGRRFDLHPLAIEDCHSPLLHAPKLDDFGRYLFIVLQGIRTGPDGPATHELDTFLGSDFLITYQDEAAPLAAELTPVAEALANGQTVREGADGLLFEVVDRMVDSVLPQLRALSEELDDLEGQVLHRQRSEQQTEILELRAEAGRIRRVFAPQMAVAQRLGRDDFAQLHPANRMYFRDVYDHLVRIDLELEGIREDAEVALNTYLSAFNNRISDVMRVLAVVGALALPASLIAGIFGTNFDNVPWLHSSWGFVAMIGTMGLVASGMALYFRMKGWF
jgi:magnesium transporter